MEYDSEKIAVVTGGGGSNIGRTVATTLASRGATVVVLDIDAVGIEETVDRIESAGGMADGIKCDVTDQSEVTDAVENIVNQYGGIDILVNNAGGSFGLTMDSIDEERFEANIELNLKSAFFVTREALPYLREGGDSSVVFVSTINALMGGFSEVGYATAKGGLHSTCPFDYYRLPIRFDSTRSVPVRSSVTLTSGKNARRNTLGCYRISRTSIRSDDTGSRRTSQRRSGSSRPNVPAG